MSLNDILKKPDVLLRLRKHPDKFRFTEPVSLVVTGGHWPPHLLITEDEETGNFTMEGPMFSLLETLAEAMNFSYTLTRPPDGYWGAPLENGSWTGMVGQIYRKEADLALGPFALTEGRAEAADMTKAVFFDKLCIIAGRGRPESDPWGFLLPLAPSVWLALLLAILLACASFTVLGERSAEGTGLLRAFGVLFMHVRSLLQQGLRREVRPASARLVMGAWLLAAMLVTWSYSGNLASLLTVRHLAQPIRELRDIVESEDAVVVMEPDTAFTELFAKLRQLMQYSQCDFYKAREEFLPIDLGMLVQKGLPLIGAINSRLHRMVETGLYNRWVSDAIANYTACTSAPSVITVQEPLNVNSVWTSSLNTVTRFTDRIRLRAIAKISIFFNPVKSAWYEELHVVDIPIRINLKRYIQFIVKSYRCFKNCPNYEK
ncbi:glutamate receptor ionotropic, kainate 4-like [Penaeus monodon]|uniref:glutamate receptor ionotropic, kainate 4-like n=1 Tax=Penaeus monodon TaxID=6687 RepID=UPI0018A7149D|nr:glutamate receptor ionotropic, kainate 4-like [Penaeus monodon]